MIVDRSLSAAHLSSPTHFFGGFWWLYLCLICGLARPVGAQRAPESELLYLSGTDKDHPVVWDFYCTSGRKSGYWTTINTPSCWEQQGFGHYDYGRDYRTYGKKFRFADEQGRYRYSFFIPPSWKDKEVNLVFEGVMTDAEVNVNGQPAGPKHQGAFYRFQYPVSRLLQFGQPNVLEVTVSKMSENASVNQAERYADYWIFGGIFRPVYLVAHPKEHLARTAISAGADGRFSIDVFAQVGQGAKTVSVQILDSQGKRIAETSARFEPGAEKITLRGEAPGVHFWTAETPHLYSALIQLKKGNNVIHQLTEPFGFRTIEVRRGDGVYINGVKIKFKGVNRHCFWPETGRTLSREIDRQDVELIKAMNMNAVRCSHYPPDKSFLQLCDSLGLYVMDELAGWQNAYDTEAGEKLVREMVVRDVNHPSIIFWSNGNEGGTNKELDDDFLLYDPSRRPVIHPHHRPGNAFNGIETNHYEKYYSVKQILSDSLIYIPTEFLHAQDDGGAAAGLQDFWELMWAWPRWGGGFIGALLDEGIVRTDLNGYVDVNRVNAPDGILGPHREKEGSFFAIKDIFSPVVIRLDSIAASFSGRLEVENRFHFTNLNQCHFRAEWVRFRKPWEREAGYSAAHTVTFYGPDAAPGAKGTFSLALPADWRAYEGLRLTAFGPDGNEIRTWTWMIGHQEQIVQDLFSSSPAAPQVIAEETDTTVALSASSIKAHFDKQTGLLKGVEYALGLNPLFQNGPVFTAGNGTLSSIRNYPIGDSHVVEVTYDGVLRWVKWTMQPTGWLKLEYEYGGVGEFPFPGVSFDCPESNVIGARWLGNGPYRVWKNRPQGGTLSVWEALYNNTMTGSAPWAYPEFKGYYSDIAWMELNTAEGNMLVASPDKGLFVRLFDFHALSGPIPHPALPPGDISFLDAIPPIGTKLATGLDTQTKDLGPQSEIYHSDTPKRRTLYFYFGLFSGK
ncbi:MAG: glycoside hydrolase family 2 [Haliscomenobacter sp.]|nr:glycoside hydrolase family 2 [Haliscomenobacter sp.]